MTNNLTATTTQTLCIMLTLIESASQVTLIIQRGDLAHVYQTQYHHMSDLGSCIEEAYRGLAALETNPPVIPASSTKQAASQAASNKNRPTHQQSAATATVIPESLIEVPLKKGSCSIPAHHLRLASALADEPAFNRAVQIAGRLMDGKLWDGSIPIVLGDPEALWRKLGHLSDREFSLFTLEDFVQVGEVPPL
jgi:hypothetical protein